MKILQLIVDAYACREDLNDLQLLLRTLRGASSEVGATVVKTVEHKYSPVGATVIVLLAESHISIYTWPEYRYAAIEIFLCNEDMDAMRAWKYICSALRPKTWKIKRLIHVIQAQ